MIKEEEGGRVIQGGDLAFDAPFGGRGRLGPLSSTMRSPRRWN